MQEGEAGKDEERETGGGRATVATEPRKPECGIAFRVGDRGSGWGVVYDVRTMGDGGEGCRMVRRVRGL